MTNILKQRNIKSVLYGRNTYFETGWGIHIFNTGCPKSFFSVCFIHCKNATDGRGAKVVPNASLVLENLVAMKRFTGVECVYCVREFYKNNNSTIIRVDNVATVL